MLPKFIFPNKSSQKLHFQILKHKSSFKNGKNLSFIRSPYYANCFHRIDFLFRPFIFLKRPFDLMKRPYGKTVI